MKEPEKVKLTQAEGEALIERIKASDLTESDRRVLERLIHMYTLHGQRLSFFEGLKVECQQRAQCRFVRRLGSR